MYAVAAGGVAWPEFKIQDVVSHGNFPYRVPTGQIVAIMRSNLAFGGTVANTEIFKNRVFIVYTTNVKVDSVISVANKAPIHFVVFELGSIVVSSLVFESVFPITYEFALFFVFAIIFSTGLRRKTDRITAVSILAVVSAQPAAFRFERPYHRIAIHFFQELEQVPPLCLGGQVPVFRTNRMRFRRSVEPAVISLGTDILRIVRSVGCIP